MVDYDKLLSKYVSDVLAAEGTTFISTCPYCPDERKREEGYVPDCINCAIDINYIYTKEELHSLLRKKQEAYKKDC